MITMAAMPEARVMFTTVIDRCMIVIGVDRSDLLVMITAVQGSLRVLTRAAMVPRMRRPVVLVAVSRPRGWLMKVRLTMVVGHSASPRAVYSSILRHDFHSVKIVPGPVNPGSDEICAAQSVLEPTAAQVLLKVKKRWSKILPVFRLKSSAFDDGQEMPQKYGQTAGNVSPPLEWDDAPQGTSSFALTLVDIHPIARDYVHWLVADINPKIGSLPEAVSGFRTSAFDEIKPYIGPLPPFGTHDYEFTVYALRTDSLGVPHGASLQEFMQAAQPESLATATLIGKFTKVR
jgi:Raf kinase inhibitor-like YbhB/YbcL family protein